MKLGWSMRSDSRGVASLAFSITIGAALIAYFEIADIAVRLASQGDWLMLVQHSMFASIILLLIYGNIVYQITRFAHYERQRSSSPAPLAKLRELHRDGAPRLTVLVPTYKEEEHVVLQTLLSAALLEYSGKQVVLLIDDPPASRSANERDNLKRMRALPARVQDLLRLPASQFGGELQQFLERCRVGHVQIPQEATKLAMLFDDAAKHFEGISASVGEADHVAAFFCERIARKVAADLSADSRHWRKQAVAPLVAIKLSEIEREYRRLASYFSAQISFFERKVYDNLSHAANKAMNLNVYLDLMGRSVREVDNGRGLRELVSCAENEASHSFPDTDYVITLDADSVLLNDYALRLVEYLERPENSRCAIAQTPYSTFHNPPGQLERIAGITTDIQHIVHQGFTHYRSTYWVGANALIREKALKDIVTTHREGNKTVRKYIHDRTVIEDTESSVDLWLKGWSLHNYPARLAYSATPPDFGALLIQRRRWANGGLVILPKLLCYVLQRPLSARRMSDGLIQAHYLVSPAVTSVGVLALLVIAFEENLRSWWLPLTALPYFVLYASDIRALGHRWSDMLRVYALNLILLPVQLGGVLASLRQILTGRNSPFARTPKVAMRTSVPPIYVLGVFGIALWCLINGVVDVISNRWAHATFALLNGVLLSYGAVVFVGMRESAEDLGKWIRSVAPSYSSKGSLPIKEQGESRPSAPVLAGAEESL